MGVAVLLLGAVALLSMRGEGKDDSTDATSTTLPTASLPADARTTAELLTERITAIPGFATTCGQEAFSLGADVFDKPERLVDAVGLQTLPCREEIVLGMAAAAQDVEFTEQQVGQIADDCLKQRSGESEPPPCAVLVGAVASRIEPAAALARCGDFPGEATIYLPAQRVVCAATYLSLRFEDSAPDVVGDEVRTFCSEQPAPARKVCTESMGGLLLTESRASANRITTVEQTISDLTSLRPAVERCRTMSDLVATCQTSVLDALASYYPMGVPSGPERIALCRSFDEPVRSECVSRRARPDEEFLEPTEG